MNPEDKEVPAPPRNKPETLRVLRRNTGDTGRYDRSCWVHMTGLEDGNGFWMFPGQCIVLLDEALLERLQPPTPKVEMENGTVILAVGAAKPIRGKTTGGPVIYDDTVPFGDMPLPCPPPPPWVDDSGEYHCPCGSKHMRGPVELGSWSHMPYRCLNCGETHSVQVSHLRGKPYADLAVSFAPGSDQPPVVHDAVAFAPGVNANGDSYDLCSMAEAVEKYNERARTTGKPILVAHQKSPEMQGAKAHMDMAAELWARQDMQRLFDVINDASRQGWGVNMLINRMACLARKERAAEAANWQGAAETIQPMSPEEAAAARPGVSSAGPDPDTTQEDDIAFLAKVDRICERRFTPTMTVGHAPWNRDAISRQTRAHRLGELQEAYRVASEARADAVIDLLSFRFREALQSLVGKREITEETLAEVNARVLSAFPAPAFEVTVTPGDAPDKIDIVVKEIPPIPTDEPTQNP